MTRKLLSAVLQEGPGQKYLIQHSAGSGKTMSIAWSAHFLADLHAADNQKVFDSVLVVSDRNVIDGQLQDAIYSFERTSGVVATIRGVPRPTSQTDFTTRRLNVILRSTTALSARGGARNRSPQTRAARR